MEIMNKRKVICKLCELVPLNSIVVGPDIFWSDSLESVDQGKGGCAVVTSAFASVSLRLNLEKYAKALTEVV